MGKLKLNAIETAYVAQQAHTLVREASQQYFDAMTQIHTAYTDAMRQQIQMGPAGAGTYQSIQTMQAAAQSQAPVQAWWNAANAIPFLGGAISSYGSYKVQSYLHDQQVVAAQQATMGQIQSYATQLGMYGGGVNVGSYTGVPATQLGAAAGQLQAYGAINTGPTPWNNTSLDTLYGMTRNINTPYGDPSSAVRMGGAVNSLAGMNYMGIGQDPFSFVTGQAGLSFSSADEATRMYAGNPDAFRAYVRRTLYTGGPEAANALRGLVGSNANLMQVLQEEQSGSMRTMLDAEAGQSFYASVSQVAWKQGNTAAASASLGNARRGADFRRDELWRSAVDENGVLIDPRAGQMAAGQAEYAESLRQAQLQQNFGAQGPGIAKGYAQGDYLSSQFSMFGDVGSLQRATFEKYLPAVSADINRVQGMLKENIAPEQREQLLQRESELMQRKIQILDQLNQAMISVTQTVSGTATAMSGGAFQRFMIRGGGGGDAADAGAGHIDTLGAEVGGIESSIQSRANWLISQGKDPRTDTTINNLMRKREGVLTEVESAQYNLANLPNSVGLRREEAHGNFMISALQNVPGSYGNLLGAMRGQIGTLGAMVGEKEGMREKLMSEGKWTEAMQLSHEQQVYGMKNQQAQLYGQISYGWESRLMSNIVNGGTSNMAFAAPFTSMMAAVNGGVENPLFGSSSATMPDMARRGLQMGSLAGATGTPEALAITALTGVAPKAGFATRGGASSGDPITDLLTKLEGGLRIVLEEPAADGTMRTRQGTGYMQGSSRMDTSSAAMAEAWNGLR